MERHVAGAGSARRAWWTVVGVLAVSVGCSAGKASTPGLAGTLTGPSTFGTSVRLLVYPDIMFADGQSISTVRVQVFDSNGAPAPNRLVYLLTGNSDAQPVVIGQLSAAQVVTGSDGTATVRYTAPAPQNFSANLYVTVLARVAAANGASLTTAFGQPPWESAQIELVAIDQRTWPPGSSHPTCAMMGDPRYGPWYTGVPIHFTTRATPGGAPIIQYLWRFGDDETKYFYGPDQVHTFTQPGDYQIFESVLDSNGEVDSCLFVHDGNPFMTVQNP